MLKNVESIEKKLRKRKIKYVQSCFAVVYFSCFPFYFGRKLPSFKRLAAYLNCYVHASAGCPLVFIDTQGRVGEGGDLR